MFGNAVFRIKIGDEKISCFEITNFQALDTFLIYLNPKKGYWEQAQPFLSRGSNKLNSSHREKKEGTSMWNTWVPWVFALPYATNFVMETENNSIQRQLYHSSII